MIVGITGGIGSGKSLVAETICSFENTTYFHADKEAKLLMNKSVIIKDKINLIQHEPRIQETETTFEQNRDQEARFPKGFQGRNYS